MQTRPRSSKQRIKEFLLANVGRVVSSDELKEVAGASEWARRLRELRDEEGYRILSHRDRADLKPGQYILQSPEPGPLMPKGISKQTRALVLERNGYTCHMCGVGAGDPDPFHPGRKIRLTLGHIIDRSKGGSDSPDNLRAVCTNCNEGLANASPPKPKRIELMRLLRRATIQDQLHALEWLEQKFKHVRPKVTDPGD